MPAIQGSGANLILGRLTTIVSITIFLSLLALNSIYRKRKTYLSIILLIQVLLSLQTIKVMLPLIFLVLLFTLPSNEKYFSKEVE
jgi:hypothetical protein